MAISNSSSYISDLLNAGNDAFSNLYEVVLTPNGKFEKEEDGKTFTMRCKDFTPPSISGGDPYRVRYVTAFVDWPSAKVNVTRTFDLTFRVDSNYLAYRRLHLLAEGNFNPNTDYVNTNLTDLAKTSFTITVNALTNGSSSATAKDKLALYTFKNCIITGITPIEYKQGDASPITTKATFIFGDMVDLQTSLQDKDKDKDKDKGKDKGKGK